MSTMLVQKLKDGIQDAVVFLRTLEQFKVPAVVQRRARNLLEKLEALQGDSIRETPPHFEEAGLEEEGSQEAKVEEIQPTTQPKAQEEAQPKAKEAQPKAKETLPKAKETQPKATEAQPTAKEAQPKAKETQPKEKETQPKTKEAKSKAKEAQPKTKEAKSKAKETQSKTKEAKSKAKETKGKGKAKEVQPTVQEEEQPKSKPVQITVESKAVGVSATPKAEEKAPPEEEEGKEAKPGPRKRDSKSILSLVKQLEEKDKAAKQAQAAYEEFKYGPKSPPQKAAEDVDSVIPEEKAEPEPEPQPEVAPVELRGKAELKPVDSTDRRSSAGSLDKEHDSGGAEEEEVTNKEEKGKKRRFGGFLKKGGAKNRSRDKSPAPQAEAGEKEESAPPTEAVPEEEKEEETDDGKPPAQVERRVKRFGANHWSKQTMSVDGTTLVVVGEKGKEEKMELVGCTVGVMEIASCNAFEVVNHPDHRQLVFRTESPRARDLWVNTIQEGINECATIPESTASPVEGASDKEEQEVPKITVETAPEAPEDSDQAKKRKESRVSSAKGTKKQNEIPELGVAIKGFVQRKTGWSKWEKSWCVVTYNAIYYTGQEGNKDYSHFTPIMPDSRNSVQDKKGPGNHPGLIIKIAGKKEHISFESGSEVAEWRSRLEEVLGISGVGELLSEDEGDDEGEELDEELYEDVDNPPPVPSSPRPAHRLPSAPDSEGCQDMADQDIYEEFDDPLPSPTTTLPPALPPNHPKPQDEPPPSLPPRPSPSLPPRGIPVKPKPPAQAYEVAALKSTTGPARPPPPADDEELYDDIVAPKASEEVAEEYDDVSPVTDAVEESYDDVVVSPASPSSELYEDMAPAPDGPQADYVIMERGEESDEGELYCEVDEPPLHTGSPLHSIKKAAKGERSSFSRVFKGKSASSSTSSGKGSHSGHLTYCPPGKSKPKELWCVVEGTQIHLYKNPSDKRPQDKLTLGDFDLEGRADGGHFAFLLHKGVKEHTFTAKTKEDRDSWLSALKGLVRSAVLNLEQDDRADVFQAKEDHIAEDDSQLTFKKGTYIRLVSKSGEDQWIGQLGNEAQVFDGKIGKFPVDKVEIAEDLYI